METRVQVLYDQHVFSCPMWARWVANDSDGSVFAYAKQPARAVDSESYIAHGGKSAMFDPEQTLLIGHLSANNCLGPLQRVAPIRWTRELKLKHALSILGKIEYSADGFVKRYPDEADFKVALKFLEELKLT